MKQPIGRSATVLAENKTKTKGLKKNVPPKAARKIALKKVVKVSSLQNEHLHGQWQAVKSCSSLVPIDSFIGPISTQFRSVESGTGRSEFLNPLTALTAPAQEREPALVGYDLWEHLNLYMDPELEGRNNTQKTPISTSIIPPDIYNVYLMNKRFHSEPNDSATNDSSNTPVSSEPNFEHLLIENVNSEPIDTSTKFSSNIALSAETDFERSESLNLRSVPSKNNKTSIYFDSANDLLERLQLCTTNKVGLNNHSESKNASKDQSPSAIPVVFKSLNELHEQLGSYTNPDEMESKKTPAIETRFKPRTVICFDSINDLWTSLTPFITNEASTQTEKNPADI